ncbi:hypothetical protein [Pseudomonas sp. H9]|uniref:hypothetical protein n=1 Tax=Pseudomonas sp. H9 TaxID=483968 RepID=UPI001057BE1A|nr:hypothetical protein [Pseudomonas sp. H9]TDF80233.1 hypothetical protein E1573_19925 [Pseudomonas sp. H9]
MLKIVPDPPQNTYHTLEDILVQISEYLVCAMTVAHQTVLLHSSASGQTLSLTTLHEIDNAHRLVELALSKVQLQH